MLTLCAIAATALTGDLRPVLHFTPERNWINDPNGLIWVDGEYHLFCQYNPEGDQWGHMSWGHAVSEDLLDWRHLPVAIPEADGVMAFSGTAVLDHDNTAGFGTPGHPAMVAIYTGHDTNAGHQHQNLAYSTDRGRSWTRHAGNPVLDLGVAEFRDPKVFWHAPTKRWVMVVSLAAEHKALFFASPDLKHWTRLSEFGPEGRADVPNWECPDLFELPLEGGGSRWVLVVSVGGNGPTGGPACQYFVGDFDGQRFVNENPPDTVLWLDRGCDLYAFQSYQDEPQGKRIGLAWMASPWYAGAAPTSPWRGSMTLPRMFSLRQTPEGVRLAQQPIPGLADHLRARGGRETTLPAQAVSGVVPTPVTGQAAVIEASFRPGDAARCGLRLRTGDGQYTVVGYDAERHEVSIDRTHSGTAVRHLLYDARQAGPVMPDPDRTVRLTVVVDAQSVEVFANDGLVAITSLVFPSPGSRGVSLFAEGGSATLESLHAVSLDLP